MAKVPNGGMHIIVEGLARARAELVTLSGQVLRATVKPAPEQTERTLEVDAYVRRLHELIDRALSVTSGLSQELRGLVAGIDDPLRLAYLLSSLLDMKADEKQQILEHDTLIAKLQAVATALNREIALLELKGKIETAAQQEMTDAQRQYFLRQQLKAIQDELGEGEKPEAQELRRRVAAANLPEPVHRVATREIDRLERMTPASPEYQMIRTYIDWVLDVPWSTTTEDRLDPVAARAGARRGSLRPRQGQGADRRIPGGAEAEVAADRHAVDEGPDPVLRRAARRRQDVARPVDRPRDEPEVRPDLARRRARRSRDPRPSPDLHRRHSRPHRPGAQAGGRDEPGVHARRDRQDQRRIPGRSGGRAARSARPGAEPFVPRSLSRDQHRSLEGAVHRHVQPARHDPPGAARSHGDHLARRLQRGREAAHRAAVPRSRGSSKSTGSARSASCSTTARSGGSSPSTRARPA